MASSAVVGPPRSLVEATAQLWKVQEPKDVVRWLRRLRRALLQEGSSNSYYMIDPSDVFLAIQGPSIRFEKKKPKGYSETARHEERWEMLLEAMLATSALARVCVGPAWWHQALQRRCFRSRTRRNSQRDPHCRQITLTTDDSSSNMASGESSGSCGPQEPEISLVPANSFHHDMGNPVYLPIPEILPAAMLRFAANAIEKADSLESKIPIQLADRIKLVEAQLSIIQHVCCAHQSAADYDHDLMEWNIPGAHGIVGLVLASSLRLVCTGGPKPCSSAQLLSFVVVDERENPGDNVTEDLEVKANPKAKDKVFSLPPVMEAQWKSILVVTRATTDSLSSGWRPLPRGREGHDVILSLLVVASRGVKLHGLSASKDETAENARKERLVATSCATAAISALLSLANRGFIPLELQGTLVRTACRLRAQLGATMENVSHLLYPLFGDDRLPNALPSSTCEEEDEIDDQIASFSSQRELCLTDISGVLWAMLSNETSVARTIEVLFSIIKTATRATGNKDSSDSPLFNKLKWNDQTEDDFLADCATAICVLSSALWGVAPDFADIPLLRIFWHDAIKATGKLLSTVHSQFAVSDIANREKQFKAGGPLVGSNYFNKQVQPLVIAAIGALNKAIEAEIRFGGILSILEWESLVELIETAIVPWLDYSCTRKAAQVASRTVTDTIHAEAESVLLCIAELLDQYFENETIPAMEYVYQRRLFLCLLRNSGTVMGRNADSLDADSLDFSAVRAWARFGTFPYRLEGWCDVASELLQETFVRHKNGAYLHSSAVRTEALRLITFNMESSKVEVTGPAMAAQSILVMTKVMPELYTDLVTRSILPALRLSLVDEASCRNCYTTEMDEHISMATEVWTCDLDSNGEEDYGGIGNTEVSAVSTEDSLDLQLYAVNLTGRLYLDGILNREQGSTCLSFLKFSALQASTLTVRLESLRQLGLCLKKVVDASPLCHEDASFVLGVVCRVLVSAAESLVRDNTGLEKSKALATSALTILGCLQLQQNASLALHLQSDTSVEGDDDTIDVALPSRIHISQQDGALFQSRTESTTTCFTLVTTAMFEMLRKTAYDGQPRQNTAQEVLSSLRTKCFNLLTSLLGQGVALEIPQDAADLFKISTHVRPDKCRNEDSAQLNALVCIVEQLLATAMGRVCDAGLRPTERAVIDLLVSSCQCCDPHSAIKICRSLLATSASAEKAVDDAVARGLQMALLSRLEQDLASLTNDESESQFVNFLVSTLCWGPFVPMDDTAIGTFDCCFRIMVATYRRTQRNVQLHVALLCMLRIVNQLTSEEARASRRQVLAFFDEVYSLEIQKGFPVDVMEGVYAPIIVREAMEQCCHSGLQFEREERALLALSRHRALTIEYDNLHGFPVEQDDAKFASPCAAWLYDNEIILTCRLGSSTSCCQGYVEIVLRTPLIRKRVLVPIPGAVALEDPEFTRLRYGPRTPDTQISSPALVQFEAIKTDSTAVLDQAKAVLDRFESILSDGIDTSGGEEDSLATTDDDDMSSASTVPTTQDTLLELNSVASLSEKSLTARAMLPATLEPPATFFQDWMLAAFSWHIADDDKIHLQLGDYLRRYAFTISDSNDCTTFGAYKLHNGQCKQLRYDAKLERAMSILDRSAPTNTYKFSLLYLGPRQSENEQTTAEARLLGATTCSPAFHRFASQLGDMTPTQHLKYFSAGLDTSGRESDGQYTLAWSSRDHQDIVVYHVAHLMPEGLNNRKRHIGNDAVLLLFDESLPARRPSLNKTHGAPIVSGHFNFATISVKMLPQKGLFRVSCRIRNDLTAEVDAVLVPFAGDNVVSETCCADFVRSLAMNIDIACRAIIDGLPPPSNCLERCRQIHEMKRYHFS